jgi:hypothetical protein
MSVIKLICWHNGECALYCTNTRLSIGARCDKNRTRDLNLAGSTMTEKVQIVWCRADMPLRRTRCVLLASSEKLASQMTLMCVTETPACRDIAQILSTCCAADLVARCAACMYVRPLLGYFSCVINELHVTIR